MCPWLGTWLASHISVPFGSFTVSYLRLLPRAQPVAAHRALNAILNTGDTEVQAHPSCQAEIPFAQTLACLSRPALMRVNKGTWPKRCSQVPEPRSAQSSPLLRTAPGDLPGTFLPDCSHFSASMLDCDLGNVRVLAARNVPA